MNPETIMSIGGRALEVALLIAAPMLIVGLVTGLIIGAFQAATSINEQTLTFVPKLIVVAICLAIFGGSIMMLIADFTQEIFARIPEIAR